MTKHEAAEIVFLGEEWENCRECGGWVKASRSDAACNRFLTCNACGADGKVITQQYKEACILLGIPEAHGPKAMFEYSMQGKSK